MLYRLGQYPRHKANGYLYDGADPDKFGKYFYELLKKSDKEYDTDMIFVFAWNEWAEGGYLEPDSRNGFGYLENIKKSLDKFQCSD